MALQEEATARLAQTKKSFYEGMKVAKEVKADLDYVYRRVMYVFLQETCWQRVEGDCAYTLWDITEICRRRHNKSTLHNTLWRGKGSHRRHPDGLPLL